MLDYSSVHPFGGGDGGVGGGWKGIVKKLVGIFAYFILIKYLSFSQRP